MTEERPKKEPTPPQAAEAEAEGNSGQDAAEHDAKADGAKEAGKEATGAKEDGEEKKEQPAEEAAEEDEETKQKREQFAKDHETDTVFFTSPISLYRYNFKEKAWAMRGKGKIRVSLEPKTNKYRVMHIREKIYKLGCNHFITDAADLEKYVLAENAWTWTTLGDDCGDGLGPMQKFIAKFPGEEDFREFERIFKEGKEHNRGLTRERAKQ